MAFLSLFDLFKKRYQHLPVFGLFGLSILIGLFGIPFEGHFDEGSYLQTAEYMLKTGSLLPGWYGYPSFIFYFSFVPMAPEIIQYGLLGKELLGSWSETLKMNVVEPLNRNYIERLRLISMPFVLSSLLTIYLFLWKWRRRWMEAILAAALVGGSWEMTYQARWYAPDPIMLGFTCLCLVCLGIAFSSSHPCRWIKIAAVWGGVACSTKYTGGILVLPLAAAALLQVRWTILWKHLPLVIWGKWSRKRLAPVQSGSHLFQSQQEFWKEFWGSVRFGLQVAASFLIAFAVVTPAIVFDTSAIFNELMSQRGVYDSFFNPYGTLSPNHYLPLLTYLTAVVLSPYVPIALFFSLMVALGVWVLRKDLKLAFILLPLVVFYVAYMGSHRVMIVRNYLLLIPFLAIFASIGCVRVYDLLRHYKNGAGVFLGRVWCGLLVVMCGFNFVWLWNAGQTIEARRNNPDFEKTQMQELLSHIESHPSRNFYLSYKVRAAFQHHGLLLPSNIVETEQANLYGVYYSHEALERHYHSIKGNRFGFYEMLPSGPYDINLTYYSTWVGPNRIVIAPIDPLIREIGRIFPSVYQITPESLEILERFSVPPSIQDALKPMFGKTFTDESAFVEMMQTHVSPKVFKAYEVWLWRGVIFSVPTTSRLDTSS